LSESQLARLAELGQERTANVGDVLYRIGDRSYPFIVILEGEVAIDATSREAGSGSSPAPSAHTIQELVRAPGRLARFQPWRPAFGGPLPSRSEAG
jgi:hypothetical protein